MVGEPRDLGVLDPAGFVGELMGSWPSISAAVHKGSAWRRADGLLATSAWRVRWDLLARESREKLLESLPSSLVFHTSGRTGPPQPWLRDAHQLSAEVELLRDICRTGEADGIVTFAPPEHLYGFLLSFLLPATEGLPVRFVPAERPVSVDHDGL